MNTHPPKLLVIFPMHEPRDYRRHLTAIDDTLVVHHRADGSFQLDLRPMVTLKTRGTNSYATTLVRLAADLEAGYHAVIVDRDQFLGDLERLALQHATAASREEVEKAAHVVSERTRYQTSDHLDTKLSQYKAGRMIIAARPRRTEANRDEASGLNCQLGIPTPRSEQLWHSLRHEWCNPRAQAAGHAAWEKWCRANRPSMPQR